MVEHLHRVSFSAERTPRTEMLAGKCPHSQAERVVATMKRLFNE